MRFLLGVAEAGFIPGMTLYILLWVPLRQRARMTAYWILATPFAGIVGGPLGGLLLQLDGVLGFKGWQWLFIAEDFRRSPCDRTYFYLTPTPAKRSGFTKRAAMAAAHACRGGRENSRGDAAEIHLGAALLNWRVLVLGLLYIGMNMGLPGINNWMPTSSSRSARCPISKFERYGDPMDLRCGGGGAVGPPFGSRNERYVNLAIPLIVGAIGFVASAYVGSPLLGIVCLSIAVMGIIAGYTVFWVVPGTFLTGAAVAGGIALVNSLGNLGGFIAPFTIGWIKQTTGSFTDALLVLAGAMVVSGVIAFLIRPARTNADVGRRIQTTSLSNTMSNGTDGYVILVRFRARPGRNAPLRKRCNPRCRRRGPNQATGSTNSTAIRMTR